MKIKDGIIWFFVLVVVLLPFQDYFRRGFRWWRSSFQEKTTKAAELTKTKVVQVIDGETLRLADGQIVRLIGVDTATSAGHFFVSEERSDRTGKKIEIVMQDKEAAMEFLRRIVEGKNVWLEFDRQKTDVKGKLWAYVYVGGPFILRPADKERGWFHYTKRGWKEYIFVNAAIIKRGYASPEWREPNKKYAELFETLYQEAREKRRGFWETREGDFCETHDDCQYLDCREVNSIYGTCPFENYCHENKCECGGLCDVIF